jgi:hypothetical protein
MECIERSSKTYSPTLRVGSKPSSCAGRAEGMSIYADLFRRNVNLRGLAYATYSAGMSIYAA